MSLWETFPIQAMTVSRGDITVLALLHWDHPAQCWMEAVRADLCLVPDLRQKVFCLSSLRVMLTILYSRCPSSCLENTLPSQLLFCCFDKTPWLRQLSEGPVWGLASQRDGVPQEAWWRQSWWLEQQAESADLKITTEERTQILNGAVFKASKPTSDDMLP